VALPAALIVYAVASNPELHRRRNLRRIGAIAGVVIVLPRRAVPAAPLAAATGVLPPAYDQENHPAADRFDQAARSLSEFRHGEPRTTRAFT
jgi:hypothetical protein